MIRGCLARSKEGSCSFWLQFSPHRHWYGAFQEIKDSVIKWKVSQISVRIVMSRVECLVSLTVSALCAGREKHWDICVYREFFFPLPLQSGLGQRDSSLINTRRISTEQNPSELTELWFTWCTTIWFMLTPNYLLNIMLNSRALPFPIFHFQS